MIQSKQPEVWLRGPLQDISPLLQPVAHALLQAREEVNELMRSFPPDKLWIKLHGLASVGFHLQHLKGVLDRLFTYAQNLSLSEAQLQYLKAEGNPILKDEIVQDLVEAFNKQVDVALEQLRITDEKTLSEFRGVGRAQLPSTVLGLLFHSAEHTMRHLGQLLVTVKMVTAA